MRCLLLCLVIASCGGESSPATPGDLCDNKPCLTRLHDATDWALVSQSAGPGSPCDLVAQSKFLLPAGGRSVLPGPVFQDVKVHAFHLEFMTQVLGDLFGQVSPQRYLDLVARAATRTTYGGALYELSDASGVTVAYGFDMVWDRQDSPPTLEDLTAIHQALDGAIDLPVVYAPRQLDDVDQARLFMIEGTAPFPITLPRDCRFGVCDQPDTFCLDVPEPIELCAHFVEGRSIQDEYQQRLRLTVPAGSYKLPMRGEGPLPLLGPGLAFPEQVPVAPADGGRFHETAAGWGFEQRLRAGDETLDFVWDTPFSAQNTRLVLEDDDGLLLFLLGVRQQGPADNRFYLGSCHPQLEHWRITVQLARGSVVLDYRYTPPFAGSGPLYPVHAEVTLDGQTRTVSDHFKLVYAGEHHNWHDQFWILFDEPIGDAHGIWLEEDELSTGLERASTLTAEHQAGELLEVESFTDEQAP